MRRLIHRVQFNLELNDCARHESSQPLQLREFSEVQRLACPIWALYNLGLRASGLIDARVHDLHARMRMHARVHVLMWRGVRRPSSVHAVASIDGYSAVAAQRGDTLFARPADAPSS